MFLYLISFHKTQNPMSEPKILILISKCMMVQRCWKTKCLVPEDQAANGNTVLDLR